MTADRLKCPQCGGTVDTDGWMTSDGCTYCPSSCEACGLGSCDQSC